MRLRIHPKLPPAPELDHLESRFPAGTRSGEGSDSLHVFLESARKSRVPPSPPAVAQRRREAAK